MKGDITMQRVQSYSYGSTARKLYYDDDSQRSKKQVKRKKVVKKVKQVANFKSTAMILCVLALSLLVVYRFNVISEKNLSIINFKNDLSKLESNIASIEMDSYTKHDLNYIEDYAKQKLGMQKPDTAQVIYVDTSNNEDARFSNEDNFLNNLINAVKGIFIFK